MEKKHIFIRQLLSLGRVILIWNAIQWILNCLLGVYSFDCIVDVMKSAYTAFSGLWYIWALLIIQVVVASVYMKKYSWAIYIFHDANSFAYTNKNCVICISDCMDAAIFFVRIILK